MTIAKNAGVERLLIVKKIMQSSLAAGYAQCWVIFLKREGKGIIKPAYAVRSVLLDAVGAPSWLTTAKLIAPGVPKEEKDPSMVDGRQHGGRMF